MTDGGEVTHAPSDTGTHGASLCGAPGWIVVGGPPTCRDCLDILETQGDPMSQAIAEREQLVEAFKAAISPDGGAPTPEDLAGIALSIMRPIPPAPQPRPDLRVDPARRDLHEATGIYIRALDGTRWVSADIAELDADSLRAFLTSRGDSNPWAESVVLAMLGHPR